MSDLAKALKETKSRPARVPSRVARILAAMQETDPAAAREFKKALEDPNRVSTRQLARVLSAHGYECASTTIHKYRLDNGIASD